MTLVHVDCRVVALVVHQKYSTCVWKFSWRDDISFLGDHGKSFVRRAKNFLNYGSYLGLTIDRDTYF